MVKQAKAAAKKMTNLIKSNRILMIVCVFLVMGLAITLINYLQSKTLERFASAIDLNNSGDLTAGAHGSKHTDCLHINEAGDHHLCGHVHGSAAVGAAGTLMTANGYNNATGYKVNNETGQLTSPDGGTVYVTP